MEYPFIVNLFEDTNIDTILYIASPTFKKFDLEKNLFEDTNIDTILYIASQTFLKKIDLEKGDMHLFWDRESTLQYTPFIPNCKSFQESFRVKASQV